VVLEIQRKRRFLAVYGNELGRIGVELEERLAMAGAYASLASEATGTVPVCDSFPRFCECFYCFSGNFSHSFGEK
jgi:hypothetical protein